MIDDNLVKYVQGEIDNCIPLHPQRAQELLSNYVSLIKQNAELHKANAKLRTENKELYQESARDKGL